MRFCLPMTLFFFMLSLSSCDWKKEKNTATKPPPKPKDEEKIVFKASEKKSEVQAVPRRVTVKECESNDMVLDDFADADIVAVLVYADWCPFSQEYGPLLEGFTKQDAYKFSVLRINADALPGLAHQLDVTALPKTMFYIKGRRVGEFVGSIREDKLGIILDNLMRHHLSQGQGDSELPSLPKAEGGGSPLPNQSPVAPRSTL